MSPGDFFLFYIALGIILLVLTLLALPTLLEHSRRKNKK